jgi:hypothetical protein
LQQVKTASIDMRCVPQRTVTVDTSPFENLVGGWKVSLLSTTQPARPVITKIWVHQWRRRRRTCSYISLPTEQDTQKLHKTLVKVVVSRKDWRATKGSRSSRTRLCWWVGGWRRRTRKVRSKAVAHTVELSIPVSQDLGQSASLPAEGVPNAHCEGFGSSNRHVLQVFAVDPNKY